MKAILFAALASAVALASLQPARAAEGDDYPKRPVKLLVPNAPGSSNDTLSRILAQYLGQELGQNVVVENQAGASGLVGMEMGKNAAPDGYTLIAGSPSGTTIAASLRKNLTYDPLNDYEYISMYAVLPNLLVVNPSVPANTLPQLLEYLRNAKGDVFMASAGPGSQSHLAGAMLQQMGKFPSVHVPYKGGGPQVLAVMSGEAQWTITPASSVLGHTRTGKLRAIAQSLPQRTPLIPDVPSVSETIPGYTYSAWNGLLAPKGTPRAALAKIRAALARTVARPEVKEGFGHQGAEAMTNSPEEFRGIVQSEMESTAALVKAIDLKIDR
jgi:tripartite-type tricarboxylate transporter receptor subunit TctC